MYSLSKRSRKEIKDIKEVLIDVLMEGIKDSPYDFGCPEFSGLRTDPQQIDMYAQGRTTKELIKKGIKGVEGRPNERKVTWTLNSYHKTGKAFDIYAYVNGRASWDLKYLEPIARHLQKVAMDKFCLELDWGYDLWGKDGAHFQIK